MKVAVYSTHPFDKAYLEKAARGRHELIFVPEELNESTLHLAASCEAAALFTSDNASAVILEKLAARGLKYLVLRSVGFDHVDLPKAKQLGIRVANVPAYSPYSVAEHAVTLLLALKSPYHFI